MTQEIYDIAMNGYPPGPKRRFSVAECVGTICTLAIWATMAALFAGVSG